MKKIILLFTVIFSLNALNAQKETSLLTLDEVVDYMLANQKSFYNYDKKYFTDSIVVKDFNFKTFVSFGTSNYKNNVGYKLFFNKEVLKRVSFIRNRDSINFNIFHFNDSLKFATDPYSSQYDIFAFNLIKSKVVYFNYNLNTLKYYADDENLKIEKQDLKKIMLLDNNFNALTSIHLNGYSVIATSRFIYHNNKIYEEIMHGYKRKDAGCKNLDFFSFNSLCVLLESPTDFFSCFSGYNRYLVEIVPYEDNFYWYRDFEQKFPKIPTARFNNSHIIRNFKK